MKLPLVSTVVGLLFGIAVVVLISPQTTEGVAFVLLVVTLVVTAIGLVAGRLWAILANRRASRRNPKNPQG